MKVKITITSDPKASKALKKHLEEKEAFRKAVRADDAATFAKQHHLKLGSPVRV